MELGELRRMFREKADDLSGAKLLWEDPEVDKLINLGYTEAVDRGLLIFDHTNFTITTIANEPDYLLDPRIIRIKQAWLVGLVIDGVQDDDVPMFRLTSDEVIDWTRWYRFGADIMYNTVTFGAMRFGVREDRTFFLVPKPTEVRTIRLEVWLHEPAPLVDDHDVPAVEEIYHSKMLSWALHLAYEKADSQTQDTAKAAKYEADFERDFGPSKTAKQRRAQLENRTLRVRPSPF